MCDAKTNKLITEDCSIIGARYKTDLKIYIYLLKKR